jgi:hypothetical protein
MDPCAPVLRDLERLISEGLVERLRNIREISSDLRDKTWYRETEIEVLYVYVPGWEWGSPEFRRHVEPVPRADSHLAE